MDYHAPSLILGLLLWVGAIVDGFATVVLPRTVAPMRRLSGRFYKWSWWLWSRMGRRIQDPANRLSFLSIYGPLSVMLLMVIWGALAITGFAFIYLGLGERFVATTGEKVGFGTLWYMSGSTFMTLGLGDVSSPNPLARMFMIFESATGMIFLGLVITYMPLLDQAYSAREVGNLLFSSRAGSNPTAIRLLHRYAAADHSEILRGNLREAERWMADVLQSHLSHPVLCFYRPQHVGESWLVSLTVVLDTCALLIVAGEGLPREQARLTYRLGLTLLADLVKALALAGSSQRIPRLTEADLPALRASLKSAGLSLNLGATESNQLLRMSQRYDFYLQTLTERLLIALPPWVPTVENLQETAILTKPEEWDIVL
jgi:hypothetical protein